MLLDGSGFWLVITFNVLQSLYLVYMARVRPHEETLHNRLEYFNELGLIWIQYMMFIVLLAKYVSVEIMWSTSWAVTGFIGLVFCVNIGILIFDNVKKLKLWMRKKKY